MPWKGLDQFDTRKETVGDLETIVGTLRLMINFLDDNISKRETGRWTYCKEYKDGIGYTMRELQSARDYLNLTVSCLRAGLPKET